MFGLSTWELLIIIAVALIFVGPDQLPKVARTIGKGMRQVRGVMGKVDDEMRKAVREVSVELDDDGEPLPPTNYHPPNREPGAGRTMDEAFHGPLDPVPDSRDGAAQKTEASVDRVGTPPKPETTERDWSQVGKGAVPGRVAMNARPPEPTESTDTPAPLPAQDAATEKPAT